MSYQVLARKWRPHDFGGVIGQGATLKSLQQALNSQQVHHAYLFTGTRGVGKTTLARILAKSLNCETGISANPCGVCGLCTSIDSGTCVDVIEVDAASRTKVEDTRDLLDNVPYAPVNGRFKVYIIDEVHMLSKHSFNALLKTLEEPPEHVKFILATTDPQKLPDTVVSRCLQFHLRNLSIQQIQDHLQNVLQQENIEFEKGALEEVAQCARGSMRDALSLLEQVIAYSKRNVTVLAAKEILGTSHHGKTLELLRHIIAADAKQAIAVVRELCAHNADFNIVLKDLQTILYQATLAQIVPDEVTVTIKELASKVEAVDLQTFYQISLLGVRDLPYAPDLVVGFEMIVLRMIAFQPIFSAPHLDTKETAKQPEQRAHASSAKTAINAKQISAVANNVAPKMSDVQKNNKSVIPPKLPSKQEKLAKPSEWSQITSHLNLAGISKMIVEHCTVDSWQDQKIVLTLNEAQKPMLNDKHVSRIQEALQNYLEKKVQVQINVGANKSDAPAIVRQNVAEQSISNDKTVQEFAEAFGAKILEVKAKE